MNPQLILAKIKTYPLPIGDIPGTVFIELRTSDLLAHACLRGQFASGVSSAFVSVC